MNLRLHQKTYSYRTRPWFINISSDGETKSKGDPPIGNWTLIQRWHVEKSDAFKDNGWIEYRNGFGETSGGEYWMGLENMRQLLETDRWQLFIGLRSLKYPTWSYIIYNDFRIGEEIKGARFFLCDASEIPYIIYLTWSVRPTVTWFFFKQSLDASLHF